jgi:tRNA G37 N-methylase Trm5
VDKASSGDQKKSKVNKTGKMAGTQLTFLKVLRVKEYKTSTNHITYDLPLRKRYLST